MNDYEELLRKYIQYVRDCEGTDFIEGAAIPKHETDVMFTESEWEKLLELSQ